VRRGRPTSGDALLAYSAIPTGYEILQTKIQDIKSKRIPSVRNPNSKAGGIIKSGG